MDFEIERILLPSLTKEGSRIRPISVERFYMAQISRRYFLKSSGAAVAAYFALPSFLLGSGRDQPILIVIFQRGAADGLSMVAPFGDKHYYDLRPQIAIAQPARGSGENAIDLDGFFGLHPSLSSLKPIYDENRLAIVHAVGSPDNTRSHFDAQDYMESGTPGNKSVTDGWLNRYLQGNLGGQATPFRAVAISANLPRSLMGSAPAVAMQRVADFGIRGGGATPELEELFAEEYRETFEAVRMLRGATSQQYTPGSGVQYPNSPFGQALMQVAQLAKSFTPIKVTRAASSRIA